jgi:hypothetical protein
MKIHLIHYQTALKPPFPLISPMKLLETNFSAFEEKLISANKYHTRFMPDLDKEVSCSNATVRI